VYKQRVSEIDEQLQSAVKKTEAMDSLQKNFQELKFNHTDTLTPNFYNFFSDSKEILYNIINEKDRNILKNEEEIFYKFKMNGVVAVSELIEKISITKIP